MVFNSSKEFLFSGVCCSDYCCGTLSGADGASVNEVGGSRWSFVSVLPIVCGALLPEVPVCIGAPDASTERNGVTRTLAIVLKSCVDHAGVSMTIASFLLKYATTLDDLAMVASLQF